MGGCARADSTVSIVNSASEYLGLSERVDREQLHQLTGVDPVRTQWCAAFVNAILELNNVPTSRPNPLLARSFLTWGSAVDPSNIQQGDVVVFPRGRSGWQGHVGFYIATVKINDQYQWMILGGNQDNTVSYDFYDPQRALAVRRWEEPIPYLTNAE